MKKGNHTNLIENTDEEQVWLSFKGGDEQAFAKIFHLHHKKLCNYGFKIIPDKDIVKDCVQDLFISLRNGVKWLATREPLLLNTHRVAVSKAALGLVKLEI